MCEVVVGFVPLSLFHSESETSSERGRGEVNVSTCAHSFGVVKPISPGWEINKGAGGGHWVTAWSQVSSGAVGLLGSGVHPVAMFIAGFSSRAGGER